MEEFILRGQVIAHSFYSELEKIATWVEADDLARAALANRAARQAAKPDLVQKLKPGTGSLFKAVGERFKLHRTGKKLDARVQGGLDQLRNPGAEADPELEQLYRDLKKDTDALGSAARVRKAENKLYGQDTASRPPPSPESVHPGKEETPRSSRVRNVAFGTGLGAAGVLGGQYYLKRKQQEPVY